MNNKQKQMKLKEFSNLYGIPRTTILGWVPGGFPAYKLHGHWYVDIEQYYEWRKEEHINNYKYATLDKSLLLCYDSNAYPMHAKEDIA